MLTAFVAVAVGQLTSLHGSELPSQLVLTADSPRWVDDDHVRELATDAAAVAGPALVYVKVDPTTRTVRLSLYQPSDALLQQLRTRFGDAITVLSAANSNQSIQAAWQSIEGDFVAWHDAGVHIRQLYATEAGYLRVTVSSDVDTAQSQFDRAVGRGVVTVVPDTEGPLVLDSKRYDDSSPWNGGDLFYTQTGTVQGCTAGFPVEDAAGTDYMLTAAHCFEGGDVIKNGYFWCTTDTCLNPVFNSTNSNTKMGDCCYRQDNPNHNGTLDAAVIRMESSRLVFICGWDCPYTAQVTSAIDNMENLEVCVSGGYDGERCGIITKEVPITDCSWQTGPPLNFNYCHDHLARGWRDDKAWVGGSRDSGAPVYKYSGSLVQPMGSYIAHTGTVNCPSGSIDPTHRACGNVAYWTTIKPILNKWGLHINTDGI
jgi:hypothetical protein